MEQAQQGNIYAENLENILDTIREDLDKGRITIKDLQTFLNIKSENNGEDVTKKKKMRKIKVWVNLSMMK